MINSAEDITVDSIKAIMKNAPIKTKQSGVSIPVIKRYYTLLQDGSEAPSIKVFDNIIIDGNHRYVAGFLFGVAPLISPGLASSVWQEKAIIAWENVHYDTEDWHR